MKVVLVTILFASSAFAQSPTAVAPACGPKSVIFDVSKNLDDTHHTLAQPEPGTARIYFIEDDGPLGNHQHYTIKIGLDGAWVGAYKQNSYFYVSVEPGEHHVCANVQSSGQAGANVALAHFTAEPGKVYYFRTQFIPDESASVIYAYLELDQPDSDQAKYLIASYPLSVSNPRK
jgi:hypothetical protein